MREAHLSVSFRVASVASDSAFVSGLPFRWIWSVVNNDVTNHEFPARTRASHGVETTCSD